MEINPKKYSGYLKATKKLLGASQKEKFPYLTVVFGRKFIVERGVFSPKYFHDTEIFARHLPVRKSKKLLEIGCGTGAVGITAVLRGYGRAILTDINKHAVKNARKNVKLFKLGNRVKVRFGNLFRPIHAKEKFDAIFWNLPFANSTKTKLSVLEKAVADPYYHAVRDFLAEAPAHLNKNGTVFIGFSSTLGKTPQLKKYCRKAKLALKMLYREKSSEVFPVYFELFEARPSK